MNLAEWSCSQVQKQIIERGDDKEWADSFDGFYLTQGHYSNNSSATLHDHFTGRLARFVHHTKREPGHNWSGTSGGAEADMLNEVLGKAKEAGFVIKENDLRQRFINQCYFLSLFSRRDGDVLFQSECQKS